MKKLFYLAICIPVLALGQSTDQNYVKSTTYKQPTTTSNPNPDVNVANVQVSYFDGLGRPIQQIAHKQSNTGKDIVTFIEYDQYGRQTKEYLPYVSTGASVNFLPNAKTDLLNFYSSPNPTNTGNPHFEATANPFSEKQLESSPLSRVFKQAAPGNPWAMGSGKEIKFDYQTNIENEVKFFKVVSSWNASKALYEPAIVQTSFYTENQLYKTITKDENWTSGKNNTTEEFKDKEGKVVLKRTYNNEEVHDTYYIYDQFGNLTYVIPPLAEGVATQIKLDNLGYQYKYDSRNRLVEKKLPGKDWEFIVYDKIDRPIATGPAYNPYGDGTLGWMITEYDAFGRVTQTGWKQMTVTETERKNNQNTVNSGGNPFTLTQEQILTKNFYDNYSFAGAPSMPQTVEGQSATTATRGLQTGSWVRVLDEVGSTTAETSYTLYDFKFRPIRVRTTNFLGGYTEVDSKLDWSGKVEKTVTKHKYNTNATVLTTTETFNYTPQDKLDLHSHQINDAREQLIAKNIYDELGQLISKKVGGLDISARQALQTVDYSYNIRGWLTSINNTEELNDDLFSFKINYNNPLESTALFNGNISETHWKTASDNIFRMYAYQYDHLNRLLEGNYKREGGNYRDSYLEKLTYDKNGNIQSLLRHGDSDANDYEFVIDKLEYTYDLQKQNQLMKVFDGSNSPQGFKDDSDGSEDPELDYKYDNFGNLTYDANKQIKHIIYNHLNLPVEIIFASGKITYLYNATGQKVQKVVSGSEQIVTHYLQGFQYHQNKLKHFPHAEGYVDVVSLEDYKFKYVFNYTDHLGNIRLSYSDANSDNLITQDEIIEENHYYPFGLKHTAYNTSHRQYLNNEELNQIILEIMPRFAGDGSYNYKFQTKELQDELGLNVYDFEARHYMPDIGRTTTYDPLAEKYYAFSPQSFFNNNPLRFADPTGMSGEDWVRNGKNVFYDPSIKSQADATAAYGVNAVHLGQGSRTFSITDGVENGNYSYTYHDNGTVTDKNGTQVDFSSGNLKTPGGTTIVSPTTDISALDASTINNNIFGLTYPGGNNPKTYSGNYSYEYVPSDLSEYPAIGHDRRYDNLKITGASGLFTDTRAIGADYRFVKEELMIASMPGLSMKTRVQAGILGIGLGLAALPKTIYAIGVQNVQIPNHTMFNINMINTWFNVSNQGVNNAPSR